MIRQVQHANRQRLGVGLMVTLTAVVLPEHARAQTFVCPPPPEGVFGLPGPPRFADYTPPAPPPDAFAAQLDDPRWNGSWREDFAASSSPEAGVRMLRQGNHLFITFEAKADPDGAQANVGNEANADSVRLGFSRDGMTAVVANLSMSAGPPLEGATNVNTTLWWRTANGGVSNWPEQNGAPPWATTSSVRAWSGTGTRNGYSWAINIDVDLAVVGTHLDGGAPLGSDFKMWYEIHVRSGGVGIPYDWPSGVVPDISGNPPTITANTLRVADWATVYPADPSQCPSGVSIDPMSIGVTPIVSGVPSARPVHFGAGAPPNDFVVRLDDGGSTLLDGAVKARFRIANWGSQIGVGGDWRDIALEGGLPLSRPNIGDQITFHCVNPPDTSAPACFQKPAGAPSDQCLLVQLEQNGGSLVRFVRDSARRNLDFVEASRFERSAEVSLFGLNPLPGSPGNRDVYLFVKTLNLPETVVENVPVVVPEPVPPPKRSDTGADLAANPQRPRYRMDTYERFASVMPTYEVHAYYDTGRVRPGDGGDERVLAPLAPFGYFVRHEGALSGWRHRLEGEGVRLEELSPNFYRVKIPDGGSIRVHTRIDSCRRVVFGLFNCCCDFVGGAAPSSAPAFALLGLSAAAALRRRRRAPHA